MATNFSVIFDKFIRKLKGDNSIFQYTDLSEAEINDIVEDHLTGLLSNAIDTLYNYGLPTVDFYDKDDTLQQFNNDLIPQEIGLLSDLMYMHYSQEDMNKLKTYGIFFRSSEIELFSPANERKTTMDAISKLESNVVNLINNYYARDRETWNLKSIYGGK